MLCGINFASQPQLFPLYNQVAYVYTKNKFACNVHQGTNTVIFSLSMATPAQVKSFLRFPACSKCISHLI